ncbi:MAG TPA: sigma-70 family RNA polymerase sigma factor [Candidatus Desulfaltia sp.]|nr:sigma-70 family RNA polymerase sigma factor [Candidatus Desulfaltia sp.]
MIRLVMIEYGIDEPEVGIQILDPAKITPQIPLKGDSLLPGPRVGCTRNEQKSGSFQSKRKPVSEKDELLTKKRGHSGGKSSECLKESPRSPQKKIDPEPTEILLKYWPQISFRVKNSIGRATPDWEDVASEILVGVIEALRRETFRGESSLGTFIYSITTNKIIDHIRRKKRTLNEIPEPGYVFDPYIHVKNQERVRLVARYIKELKPRYADILYLHYYLDLPQSEIAEIYGLSAGTMNKLIRAARNTLKKLMKNLPLEEAEKKI